MSDTFRFPLGQWVESGIDYITETFGWFFDAIRFVVSGAHDSVNLLLTSPPFWVILVIFAVIAFAARGWVFAVGTVLGFGIILGVDRVLDAHTEGIIRVVVPAELLHDHAVGEAEAFGWAGLSGAAAGGRAHG